MNVNMNVKKIVSASIILGIGLVSVGCQTPNAGGGLSQKSPPRFIEEPDTDDFVADQLRSKATNFYNEKY